MAAKTRKTKTKTKPRTKKTVHVVEHYRHKPRR